MSNRAIYNDAGERVLKSAPEVLARARRYQRRRRKDPGYRAAQAVQFKKWAKKNKEHLQRWSREYQRRKAIDIRLRRKGLSVDLKGHIEKHSGRCDLCGGPPDGRWQRLSVDHCHRTGKFRGLLCSACNRGLGFLQESPTLLRKAIRYLTKKRQAK